MTEEATNPRIYVACLAAYNAGYLHGAWIEVGDDAWAIWDAVGAMLRASPVAGAEEWAIHDYEGFRGVRVSEGADFEELVELAGFLRAHEGLGAAVLAYYGGDLDDARRAMEERYLGLFESVADYVQGLTEECQTIPEPLRFYIDWQAMARDAEMSGDILAIETAYQSVHVFAGR